jgi:hypothetical protein
MFKREVAFNGQAEGFSARFPTSLQRHRRANENIAGGAAAAPQARPLSYNCDSFKFVA